MDLLKNLSKGKVYTFITVFWLVGAVISFPAYLFYSRIENTILDETNKQAGSIAVALSTFIENNSDKYAELYAARDYADGAYDSEYYRAMTTLLRDIKESTGAVSIYTEKHVSETDIVYILDAEDPSSKNHILPGTADTITPMKKKALENGGGVISGLVRDEKRGKLISALAPIKNKATGEILGLVGVDFSQNYVDGVIAGIRNMIITAYLVSILLVGLAVNALIAIRHRSINTDYMTKLYNKCYFDKCIKMAVSEASKNGSDFSLIVIDIDDFKVVNDHFGHLTGDEVLKNIAAAIKNQTRDNDLCFRYGGDEFVVILPNTTKNQAVAVGKRIQSTFSADIIENSGIKISISIGVAQWEPWMGPAYLTEWADKAMYSSKNKGKNQLTLSGSEA